MTDTDIKFECLRIAALFGVSGERALELAEKIYAWVRAVRVSQLAAA